MYKNDRGGGRKGGGSKNRSLGQTRYRIQILFTSFGTQQQSQN